MESHSNQVMKKHKMPLADIIEVDRTAAGTKGGHSHMHCSDS